jgi:hypothetical protein
VPRPGPFVRPRFALPDLSGPFAVLALAAVVTAVPLVAHLSGQLFGLAACLALALLVANFASPAAPVVLVFAYLFQNLFVALVSPGIHDLNEFNAIRGYNFILTAGMWIVVAGSYWLDRASFDARVRSILNVTTAVLVAVWLYFAIGLVVDPGGAIVYLRNITAPFLLFQIFTIVAYRNRVSVTTALILMAIAILVFGYVELLADEKLFRLVNGDVYLKWRMKQEYESGAWLRQLQETGRVYRSYLDAMDIDFLNTPLLSELGPRIHRLVGPNFHPISFAYALAGFSVLLVAIGHWWFVLLAFPALLVIGSKGALLLVVMVTGALVVVRRWRGSAPLWCYAALLVVYAGAGIAMGIKNDDYHVIGFVGGLKGFLQNPLGHGIGAGGNLSLTLNSTMIDWSRSQHLHSTDVAVESAVGVLLFQMGVFGVALVATLGWIAAKLWRLYGRTRELALAAAALGLLTIIANSIFQEEALFSPLALGLQLGFCGLLLGRAYRRSAADARAAPS